MILDLSSLERSIAALTAVLSRCDDPVLMTKLDDVAQMTMRAGAIQHFEFTYELCWKFMRRWIETNVGRDGIEGVTRRELFRRAAEHRLIDDVEAWMAHHAARNATSHTYDLDTAEYVFVASHHFANDAAALLHALRSRNNDD